MDDKAQARRWMLTINNPEQSDDEMRKYIENLEHIKYAIFQREKGHEKETEHFQMFLIFSISKRFSTVKNLFPTAHIEKAEGSNVQCRDYCSKSDTRVSEFPITIGEFAEERSRTDIKNFYELLDAGATDMQIRELFPSLFLKEYNKMASLRTMRKAEIYKKQERDVEVTYIWGPSGSGKSTYVRDLVRESEYFYVDTFDNSAFTGYANEDILIIDEFKGQFSIQFMNKLLDVNPVKLRGLNFLGYACFSKIYIISNFHYKDLYKSEKEENLAQYNGFVRRLHKIIHMLPGFISRVERETIWEELPTGEIKLNGITKRIKQVIEYDGFGCSKIIFDKDLQKQQQFELMEIVDDDLPF